MPAQSIRQATVWITAFLAACAVAPPAAAQSVLPDRGEGATAWPSLSWLPAAHSSDPVLPPDAVAGAGNDCLPSFSFALGARTWISWGKSDSNFGGGGPLGYVPQLSNLQWRNLTSEAGEVSASALFFGRLIVNAEFGMGVISSGHLIDDDYALPGQQGLISESISPAVSDDGMRYLTADLGWRCYEDDIFSFDIIAGYQYWTERYTDNGGVQVVGVTALGLPPSGYPFPAGLVISEKYTWQGARIGVQGVANLCPGWALKARLAVLPVTWFANDDIHYLRELTGADRANGGFGATFDLRIVYGLWRGLFVEAGYRIWAFQSGSGELTEHFSDGTMYNLPFNRATSLRQGLVLGLSYQF